VTELHGADDRGREVTHLEDWRARQSRQDDLELAGVAENQPPATRQGRQPEHSPGTELAPAGKVYDAEIVDEPARPTIKAVAERLGKPLHAVAAHEPTVRASKFAGRHLIYIGTGLLVLLKRVWDAKTNSRYERILADRFRAGDWDRLADWETRARMARNDRHQHRMDWLRAPREIAIAAAWIFGVGAALLTVIGIFLAFGNESVKELMTPFKTVAEIIAWLVAFVAVAWGIFWFLVPVALVIGVWHAGWKAGAAPRILQVQHDRGTAVVIDEVAIANNLANLGISALTQALKRGHPLIYTQIPARDGPNGVSAAVRLPPGVAAEMVVKRAKTFAANFGRRANESWPQVGDDEQILEMWIADRGALDTGAGPWPLLEASEPIDCFLGVPVGNTLRGDAAVPPLDGTSWLIGGRPGQGKTNFTRLLVMGASLDPRAEIWVFVLADNADFDPLADRFKRFAVGMGHEVAESALQALNDLLAEIQRRGQVMREKGVASAAEAGFHPLVAAFDEVHRLFQHREYGGDAAFVAEDVIKQARKYGIIVIFATQSPTSTSIPRSITREVICRVAFSVIDQVGNDALLGDGSYRNGIRATELRPGSKHSPGDRGKALTVGVVPDSDWELLLGHHVDLAGVRHVADLARQFAAGHQSPALLEPAARDLLADVAEVIGKQSTPAGEVATLLKNAFPRYSAYQRLSRQSLIERLRQEGVIVPKTGNRWPVKPEAIAEARGRCGA
jgi:S-DNA-T family DNA segregation ATPase FtsK/SpoIIIE